MKGKKTKKPAVPIFVAKDPLRIVPIEVWVDQNGKVKTDPNHVIVRGNGLAIVWTIREDSRKWRFLGNGIAVHDDPESQFINPYRFNSDHKVMLFDRNTDNEQYKYTVLLYKPKPKGKGIVLKFQDPIIENEGDGSSLKGG